MLSTGCDGAAAAATTVVDDVRAMNQVPIGDSFDSNSDSDSDSDAAAIAADTVAAVAAVAE